VNQIVHKYISQAQLLRLALFLSAIAQNDLRSLSLNATFHLPFSSRQLQTAL
jgi:hypothetical protein